MNPNFTNALDFGRLASSGTSPPTSVETTDGLAQLPSNFELQQNYPNPFNPETLINYRTSHSGRVELAIFNLLVHKIRELVNEKQSAGAREARWNGRNNQGAMVASGVYIYKLKSGGIVRTKKMILLR